MELQYRNFSSLNDDEISRIIRDLFNPDSINSIEWDDCCDRYIVNINSTWDTGDGDLTCVDDIYLYEPDFYTLFDDCIECDFPCSTAEIEQYYDYMFSLGVCRRFLENNQYLC